MKAIEIKTFVPAKDFELSQRFYRDMGFTMASNEQGVAYFYSENASFLLQDFYHPSLANNLMMHLLLEDVETYHQRLTKANMAERYQIELSALQLQPWNMLEFTLHDPSGVLWRIAQNV